MRSEPLGVLIAAGVGLALFAGCPQPPGDGPSDAGNNTGVCSPVCTNPYSCESGVCRLDGGLPQTTSCSPTLVVGGLVGPVSPPAGCIRPVMSPSVPSAWVQHFGTHAGGDIVHFFVDGGQQSITLLSQVVGGTLGDFDAGDQFIYEGEAIGNVVVPDLVTEPNNTIVHSEADSLPEDPSGLLSWYSAESVSTGAMTLPNTSAMLAATPDGMPEGTWSFTVNDYGRECQATPGCDGGVPRSYDVQVITKPGPASTTGALDLAFYIVDTSGLDAGAAVVDPAVNRMVSTLTTLYSQIGICVGTVTFYDVPAWARTQFSSSIDADKIGPCDELNQMFTLSKPDTNTINFFLVDSISSNGIGGTVVGLDGTIPAPSSVSGTVRSGAAVSSLDLFLGACGSKINFVSCGADSTAYVAAHEGGHWLGLYHTTEALGDQFDPVADTGTCGCQACAPSSSVSSCYKGTGSADSSYRIAASDCQKGTVTCAGGEDLMFWRIENSSVGLLSPQQGQIVRANLSVH